MTGFSRGRVSKAQMPTCNPCGEGDHSRCPTAITRHSEDGFSTYECACYHDDTDFHAAERARADAEYEESRSAAFDSNYPTSYGHRASAHREYQRWAEEL